MSLTAEQKRNAATIVAVGKKLGASTRDQVVAVMTALQESSLRNLPGGDRDSVGLFQQRNAWGTFDQRHDPAQAAAMFYQGGHAGQRGLFDFHNRDQMSLTAEAQAVQVSAFPDAYAKWQNEAESLVKGSGGGSSVLGTIGGALGNGAGSMLGMGTLGLGAGKAAKDAAGGAVGDAVDGAVSGAAGALGDALGGSALEVALLAGGVLAGLGLLVLGMNKLAGGAPGQAAQTLGPAAAMAAL